MDTVAGPQLLNVCGIHRAPARMTDFGGSLYLGVGVGVGPVTKLNPPLGGAIRFSINCRLLLFEKTVMATPVIKTKKSRVHTFLGSIGVL